MPFGDYNYYVYIITNPDHKVLYVGVTNNLNRRIWQHKNKAIPGFSKKYNIIKLVYFEYFDQIDSAIQREKQIKGYRRQKKVILIDKMNPDWIDLYKVGLTRLPPNKHL